MEWIAQRMMFYSKINCKCFKIFFYFQSSSLSRFHLGSSTSELGFGLHILPTFASIPIEIRPKQLWAELTQGWNDPGLKRLTYLDRNDPPQKLAETTQAETTQNRNDTGPKLPGFFQWSTSCLLVKDVQ